MKLKVTRLWWSSSCGRIELQMTPEQAQSASHQGQCDDDVRALSEDELRPLVKEFLEAKGSNRAGPFGFPDTPQKPAIQESK